MMMENLNTMMTKLARMFVMTVGTAVFQTMNNIATEQNGRSQTGEQGQHSRTQTEDAGYV